MIKLIGPDKWFELFCVICKRLFIYVNFPFSNMLYFVLILCDKDKLFSIENVYSCKHGCVTAYHIPLRKLGCVN